MPRKRSLLDTLAAQFSDESRETLLSFVLCGDVRVDGSVIRDPRLPVADRSVIKIESRRYVSRGGEKLEHALKHFKIDVAGLVCLDAGASTGGFTDCLLQHGAARVHAVDVGTNQLAWSLRCDDRVAVREQTSILSVALLEPAPTLAVADLSFRSLTGVASHLLALATGRRAVVLIKPQFEWENPPGSFDGTVPGEQAGAIALEAAMELQAEGVGVLDVCESPIRGRRGNREFLAYIGLVGDSVLPTSALSRRFSELT